MPRATPTTASVSTVKPVTEQTLQALIRAYGKQEEWRKAGVQPLSLLITSAVLPSILVVLINSIPEDDFFKLLQPAMLMLQKLGYRTAAQKSGQQLYPVLMTHKNTMTQISKNLVSLCKTFMQPLGLQSGTSFYTCVDKLKTGIASGLFSNPEAIIQPVGKLLAKFLHITDGFNMPLQIETSLPMSTTWLEQIDATQRSKWFFDTLQAVEKWGIETNNLYKHWQNEKHVRELFSTVLTLITTLIIIISLLFKGPIDRLLMSRSSLPQPISKPNTVFTEKAANAMLSGFNKDSEYLENYANKTTVILRWLSILIIPFVIKNYFAHEIIPADITVLLITFIIAASRNIYSDTNRYFATRAWKAHIEKFPSQLQSFLEPLNVEIVVYDQEQKSTCDIEITVKNNASLAPLTKKVQFNILLSVFKYFNIDFTKIKYCCIRIPGATHIDKPELFSSFLNQMIERQKLLNLLEMQLNELNSHFGLLLEPIHDREGLPTFICSMFNVERDEITNIFKENTLESNDDGKIIMRGFMPGNSTLLSELLNKLKKPDSTLRGVTSSTSNLADIGPKQLRQRNVPRQPVAAEAPAPVLEPIINIRWPSGKVFNSIETRAENYLQAGAVVPVTSPFLPANRYFCVFEINPHEVGDKVIYDKFLEQALHPRIARLQGEQGILLWNEVRSFNKFTYDLRGAPTGREKTDYIAAAKLKILGNQTTGDARCYGWSETAATGETLIHFIEYDPETH